MRTFNSILLFVLTLSLFQSCEEKHQVKNEIKKELLPNAYTYELLMFDTINKTDGGGLKQGKWIVRKLPGNIVIESGMYKDNQKQGCWVRHGQKGEFIDSIYYKNDMPSQ